MQLQQFIQTVANMREAQRNYFTVIAKAKKTKLPGDFAIAQNALKASKQLEATVDEALPELLKIKVLE
jgi:hypothetical protein